MYEFANEADVESISGLRVVGSAMFYYILNIKIMSQSLSNFCTELRAAGE